MGKQSGHENGSGGAGGHYGAGWSFIKVGLALLGRGASLAAASAAVDEW